MASLKDIRRRIASVKNTQQITKAMKMVSAAKLRRAQQAISSARPFAEKLEAITDRVLTDISASLGNMSEEKRASALQKLHPLLGQVSSNTEDKVVNKIALVVITSDRGLCGAYNTNATRAAFKKYKELSALSNNEVSLFFVGRKGQEFFAKRGLTGEWFKDFWLGKFAISKSDLVTRLLTKKFLSGEFNEVVVCYTQFRSAISQSVSYKEILPLKLQLPNLAPSTESIASSSKVHGIAETATEAAPAIFEPKRAEILQTLLPNLVRTEMYRLFADSLASEFGARMTSMDNASRNAGDMIGSLTLQANRVRQAAITKELMEIVGGAEALKG